MKFILSLILTLNVFGLVVTAQVPPPPPPPPLIYEAPERSLLQEYVNPDKSFKASFPGKPQVNKQKQSIGFSTSHSVNRMGSNSVVLVNEFDVNTEDKLDYVYESVKAGLLKQKFKFLDEKDIKIDGILGKEFSATDYYKYQKVRIFVAGKRVYLLLNEVTNWHILNQHYKEKVEEFNVETDRFFSSFKILK